MTEYRRPQMTLAEYIWLDGTEPTQQLRSKTRILPFEKEVRNISYFPDWGFDGSSTNQAVGDHSDCILKPVIFVPNPLQHEGCYIVLCEVLNEDNTPHSSNTRSLLTTLLEKKSIDLDAHIGFEQEYTLFLEGRPLGWPKDGYPQPKGPFYCGVGADKVYGRELVEEHTNACIMAELSLFGTNAEVMPGQWEFQIGYRGIEGEKADPLTISDQLWIARYLLQKIAERHGIVVSFCNKPIKGDWNGAGLHTNFSTQLTREKGGIKYIEKAVKKLEKNHSKHISDYGHDLKERLTGKHETCSIENFTAGVSNRNASIRIPLSTAQNGRGYFEDRRPGANADPYMVSLRLMESLVESCNDMDEE